MGSLLVIAAPHCRGHGLRLPRVGDVDQRLECRQQAQPPLERATEAVIGLDAALDLRYVVARLDAVPQGPRRVHGLMLRAEGERD